MVATFPFTVTAADLIEAPHTGSLQVWANVPEIRDAAGKVVLSGRLTVPLDAAGATTVDLPAADVLEGLGYTARLITGSGQFPAKSFAANPAGVALDWSQIATSVTPTPAPDVAVTAATIGSYLDGGTL